MIKYLGALGAFIRLNDDENITYNLLNIYSSSAANDLLFSASINNLTGQVSFNSASTILYVNGQAASVVPGKQWAHLTLSFEDKLSTKEENNFLIRVGDPVSSNFNIQNLYILEQSFSASAVGFLHEEFTGAGGYKIRVNDPATYTFNFTEAPENKFISTTTSNIYQPLRGQLRYLLDIDAVAEESLSKFVSASVMSGDDLFVDAHNIEPGDFVLSLADDQIYQLTASSKLISISSSVGDFFQVLYGQYLGETFFIKTSTGFELTPAQPKIVYYLNTIQTNND